MTRHQFVPAPTHAWTSCVLVHAKDPDRPRTATRGLLCEGHYLSLEQRLAELPAHLDDAEAALPRVSTGGGPKVTGTPEHPLPYTEAASEALRGAHALLASWTLLVLEEHPDGLHSPANSARTMSAFLLRHLAWCSEQPWVDDLARELTELTRDLRGALTLSRTRRVPLGPCDKPVACDVTSHAEQACPGILTATVHTLDEALPGAITCGVCGDTHEPDTWRTLARRLRGGDDAWLTYAQLSQLLRVPIGTLKRWASEDDWRRLDVRPGRFHHDDAQASYETHRLEEAG